MDLTEIFLDGQMELPDICANVSVKPRLNVNAWMEVKTETYMIAESALISVSFKRIKRSGDILSWPILVMTFKDRQGRCLGCLDLPCPTVAGSSDIAHTHVSKMNGGIRETVPFRVVFRLNVIFQAFYTLLYSLNYDKLSTFNQLLTTYP